MQFREGAVAHHSKLRKKRLNCVTGESVHKQRKPGEKKKWQFAQFTQDLRKRVAIFCKRKLRNMRKFYVKL